MPMTKDEILTEAMALEPRDRDDLAEALWQGIAPVEFTAEQLSEVRRRVAALDSGRVQGIPGEQVMQELRRRYQE
jgi:putative addiction module component (TIGR02574 family)